MKRQPVRGSTSFIGHIFVQDSAATDGSGKTALAFSAFTVRYIRAGEALSGAITAQDITTIGTYAAPTANTNIRIKEVSAASFPGVYEFQLHNDWINATGARPALTIMFTATGMAPVPVELELTGFDIQDGVRGGMTALPNAAADAAGGLAISDAGGLDLDGVLSGNTPQTGDNYTRLGVAGAGLTALGGMSTTMKAQVNTEADAAFTSYGPPTKAEMDTAFTEIKGGTWSSITDTLEAIRNQGDAAWTTGAGGSDRLLMVDTTINTLASQVSFTLNAGSADDNAYNNCTIVIEDVSTATQKAVGIVSDYVGATKTVTLKYDPAIFVMAPTDKVYILAENALKSTAANRQLDVTATGAAGIDWGNVENPTTAVDLAGTDIQLCDTVTTNTDVRGTDNAATAVNLATVDTVVDGIQTDLSNGTDGLGALKTLLDIVNTDLSNGTDGLSALKTLIDAVNTDLSNGTDGLGALKTLIDTVNTDLSNGTDGLGALKTAIEAVLTTAMTESYAADGAASTAAQALYLLLSVATEKNIAGTTMTCKKLDGSTTAATFTLDDPANATSITRAT